MGFAPFKRIRNGRHQHGAPTFTTAPTLSAPRTPTPLLVCACRPLEVHLRAHGGMSPPWWVALAPKFMVGGSVAVGIAGRRAFMPFLVVGSAFTSAAWFGAFEACFSLSKLLMPVPEKPDSSAQTKGVLTVPCMIGLSGFAGWRTCPLLEAPPKELSNFRGWIRYAGSMPLAHAGRFGLASAAAAAVTCRVVQYRGGA